MIHYFKSGLLLFFLFGAITTATARQWTLRECIDYALQNNITLQKSRINKLSAQEDIMQSQAALLPSLSASTGQNLSYQPWPEAGRASVQNGYVEMNVDKVFYNGSYGVSSNWTLWNGNRNRNTVKLNELAAQQAELDSAITAQSIQEQIAQLYVQILYQAEAIAVSRQSLETSRKNEERGQAFVEVGKMSRADLAQLTSQRAQAEYQVVEAESSLRNYKRQLKQLLQIVDDEEFDVLIPATTDEMALQLVPALGEVYAEALRQRPEIQNAQLGIRTSELNIKMAKAQKLPTVGVSASAITNSSSMSNNAWGSQLKNNFNLGAGFNVSIPLFDNRASKTAVNKGSAAATELRTRPAGQADRPLLHHRELLAAGQHQSGEVQGCPSGNTECPDQLRNAQREVRRRSHQHRRAHAGPRRLVASSAERVAEQVSHDSQHRHAALLRNRRTEVE